MRQYALQEFTKLELPPLELAVVIPTLDERDNIEPIIARLMSALAGIEWEAIFVDDASGDGTPELVARIAAADRRIRLIRRFGRRGLSSAVVEGIFASTTPVVAVMDADLQHDERILPELYRAVAREDYDLALGTRYAGGGSIGEWSETRARISAFASRLSMLLLKTPLSDPMSGFFAVKREAVVRAVPRLSSVGYKILLDLVASSPAPLAIKEIPYRFRNRTAGESKLDGAAVLDYIELLLDKAVGRWIPVKLLMFGAIGGFGMLVHLAILGSALLVSSVSFAAAQAMAVLGAMTLNFYLNNRFTYREQRLVGRRWFKGLMSFYAVCGLGALANVGVGSIFYAQDQQWWVAGLLGALIGSVWNYVATAWLTWTRR